MKSSVRAVSAALVLALWGATASAQECVDCHAKGTPGIVADWKTSRARRDGGRLRRSATARSTTRPTDVAKARGSRRPRPAPPATRTQVEQFTKGKHALAWAAMKAMPTTHALPMALMRGHEGLRRLPQARASRARRRSASCKAAGLAVRPRLLRRLPHAAHLLGARRRASPRPARPATWASTTRSGRCTRPRSTACAHLLKQNGVAARDGRGADLPDLPHARGQPRGPDRLGLPRRAAAAARGRAVGGRPGHDPAGARRARSRGQPDRPARRGQGGRRGAPRPGELAASATRCSRRLRRVPLGELRPGRAGRRATT